MGIYQTMHSVWASRLEWGKCERGHCHHCCSLVGPGECVVLLIVVLGIVVLGSVLRCGTFFTSKIMTKLGRGIVCWHGLEVCEVVVIIAIVLRWGHRGVLI